MTYFFNGGIEPPFRGEERVLVPSQKVATYDLAPEMSAAGVTDTLCGAIAGRAHNFIVQPATAAGGTHGVDPSYDPRRGNGAHLQLACSPRPTKRAHAYS